MSSQQQAIIQDQPLKVLGLFHKRELSAISFDEQKFLKLYNSLCCTICRQLFNNPVYLRCSHRFCKQCIQKYIRFTQKKSCPNCRGDLNTKRDLRIDYSLTTLIHYAFGDRQKFIEDMTQIQNAQAIILQRSSSMTSAIVRTKSFIEQQQKQQVKKKVKTNEVINVQEIGQVKVRKRKTNSKSLQNSKLIEDSSRTQQIRTQINEFTIMNQKPPFRQDSLPHTKTQKIEAEKQSSNNQQQQVKIQPQAQVVKVRRKRGRKKQIPIIEVRSHTSQQQQEFIQPVPMELQEKPQSNKKQQRSLSLSSNNIKQKPSQKIIDQAQTRYDAYEKERTLLKEQFGDNYMLSLMKVPTIDFLIEVKLQRHPDCFLTPLIPCKSIQLSSKAKLHHIFILMSKLLNLPLKNINLYANSQKITPLPYYLYKDKSLAQVNEDIWKSAFDVQVFDMKEILSSLQDARGDTHRHSQSMQINQKKKLFQGIQFERQLRPQQPRKRGRGRARKTQDKQNIIDAKDQQKRIFYYRIVTQ